MDTTRSGGLSMDLTSLLKAAQNDPRSFAAEIADSVHKMVPDSETIVAISDQDGNVFRIKASKGEWVPGVMPVEVERDHATDDVRLSQLGAIQESRPPRSLQYLFTHADWQVLCIYTFIDPPAIQQLEVASSGSPVMLVAVSYQDSFIEQEITEALDSVAPFLGLLYTAALTQQKLSAREKVVQQANQSKDPGTLLHRASRLATELFHMETVIALLPDDSGRFLDVRAIYPRPKAVDRLQALRFDFSENPESPISIAHATGKIAILSRSDLHKSLRDSLPGRCPQVLLLPLQGQLGLLICVGKSWQVGGGQHCGSFIWEDITLLEFYGDMLTILVRMLRGKDEAGLRVERTLHGAKAILHNIRQNLSILDENRVSEMVAAPLIYTLPNAIALLDDIASQLERKRLSSLQEIPRDEDVRLYGDVIAGMAEFAPALSRATGRHAIKVNLLKESGVARLPVLKSNKSALVTVFRNLVHNAVKYSRRDRSQQPWLVFEGGSSVSTCWITVSDNGIGVIQSDYMKIFEEGYRGQNAYDIDPGGLGVGLSDCREILTLIGGTISLTEPLVTEFGQASTTVRVELPRTPP